MDRNQRILELAERLLAARGYTRENTNEIEWDMSNPDSQFAMAIEDAQIMLDANDQIDVEERLIALTGGMGNYFESGPGIQGIYVDIPATVSNTGPNVQTFVQITHSLADNSTISELHEFFEKLKLLELPDDHRITGYLHTTITIEDAFVERYTEDGGLNPVRSYGVVPQAPLNDY